MVLEAAVLDHDLLYMRKGDIRGDMVRFRVYFKFDIESLEQDKLWIQILSYYSFHSHIRAVTSVRMQSRSPEIVVSSRH